MEIDPNGKILTTVSPEKAKGPKIPSHKAFGAIFKELMDDSKKADQGINTTQTLPEVRNIQLNPLQTGETNAVVDHAEKLLDTLDTYQRKLAGPEFTLRDIAPLVKEMETENEILASAIESLSGDDKLKNILNQIVIASSVEIIKFNRGDYISR